jgi:hypothetical protein
VEMFMLGRIQLLKKSLTGARKLLYFRAEF